MSFSFDSLFVYTPIPWVTILCIVLYRHDLSQLVHPFKDRCSIRDWKSVFDVLDISYKTSSTLGKTSGKGRAGFSIGRFQEGILEGHPETRIYASVIIAVTSFSLLSSLIFLPTLTGGEPLHYSRFSLLISTVLQFISALPSVFAMRLCFGPFPSPPSKFHLKKYRLGSLLRYEKTLNHQLTPPETTLRSERLWRH
jgi:hypothetical protein